MKDKNAFYLLSVALIVTIIGSNGYAAYNGFNESFVHVAGSLLRIINGSSSDVGVSISGPGFRVSEEIAILSVHLIATVVALLVLIVLVAGKTKLKASSRFSGFVLLAVSIVASNTYMIITSGILRDL